MAEKLIINAGAVALTSEGETNAAWSVAESTGAPTVTEQGAITDMNNLAIMQTAATTAEQAAVAFCILDSLLGTGVDLSTKLKRKAYKNKAGLQEYFNILSKINDIA